MKLYRAELYKLDREVLYVDKNIYATYDEDGTDNKYRTVCVDKKRNIQFAEDSNTRLFKKIYDPDSIIVKRKLNGTLEEIITDITFPEIAIYDFDNWSYKILPDNCLITAYRLSKANNRIYAKIVEELYKPNFYEILESFGSAKKEELIKKLELIESERQRQNISTKQFVKQIKYYRGI